MFRELIEPNVRLSPKRADDSTSLHSNPYSWNIELDWEEYFLAFKNLHGGDPVFLGGRLLFQDGWGYSAIQVEGPEFPPPEDQEQLRLLKLKYWKRRRSIVYDETHRLGHVLTSLKELQQAKSATLIQIKGVVGDDGLKKPERVPLDLNTNTITGRLTWLKMDLARCDEMIEELNKCLTTDSTLES